MEELLLHLQLELVLPDLVLVDLVLPELVPVPVLQVLPSLELQGVAGAAATSGTAGAAACFGTSHAPSIISLAEAGGPAT